MTKDEIEERKEAIRATTSVIDVLSRYGVQVKRGRCVPICHEPRIKKAQNAKVSDELYHCFPCNKSMDIFDITMHFNNCDFWTAFELLGGTKKPSFTAVRKAKSAKRERELRVMKDKAEKAELKRINIYISAYRNIIAEEEPFADLWCYAQNQLQLELYHLDNMMELQAEKR